MLILEKMSVPGWQLKSEYIEHILEMLEAHVCGMCKQTEAQYKQATLTVDAEYESDWNHFMPETYKQYSALEKIDWLLGTPCGCEFDFYDEDEGPLAEINVDSQS
jgi:hypothetical protein